MEYRTTLPEGAKVVAMVVFEGRLIVALDRGVFELVGSTLVPIEFSHLDG